jgi:hypothetical protein
LGVQVRVTGGTLSAADQSALQDLSKGFQSAIDGLSEEPPSLNLSGLMQFNTNDITSIDFQAKVAGQTVDLQNSGQVRSLHTNGPLGSVQVSVDTSNSLIIGDA